MDDFGMVWVMGILDDMLHVLICRYGHSIFYGREVCFDSHSLIPFFSFFCSLLLSQKAGMGLCA